MLYGDKLLYQLLLPGISEGATLKPDLEVTTIDKFPFWTFHGIGGESLMSNSDVMPKAWDWQLQMSLFHDDEDEANVLAGDMYDFLHSWNDSWAVPPTNVVPGLGHAQRLFDTSLFSKVGSGELPGHTVTHLSGSFSLQLHQA